jgi:hypothetical protein
LSFFLSIQVMINHPFVAHIVAPFLKSLYQGMGK